MSLNIVGGGEGSVSMHISGMSGGALGDSTKGDFMSLFHETLFTYSNDLVPQISKLYEVGSRVILYWSVLLRGLWSSIQRMGVCNS